MAVVQLLTTIPLLIGAPTMVQPDQPLDIIVRDTSDFPTVVVDLVVPREHSAIEITNTMLDVDGEPVDSVAMVDPSEVVMALILDDRPTIDANVVTAQQSAAVEVTRNIGDGTEIALGTPSGLQTALTTSREATIARVSGITAGAPEVKPLADLLIDSVALLAVSDRDDRHLVVVLAAAPELSEPQVRTLTETLAALRTRLHVIAPSDVDIGPLDGIAALTGGSVSASAEPVVGADAVTAAIVNRYRIVATVDAAGPHEFGLDVDGRRLTSTVSVAPAAAPTTPATTRTATTAAPTAGKAKQSRPAAGAPVVSTAPDDSTAPALAPPLPDTASTDSNWVPEPVDIIVLLPAVAMAVFFVVRLRRW